MSEEPKSIISSVEEYVKTSCLYMECDQVPIDKATEMSIDVAISKHKIKKKLARIAELVDNSYEQNSGHENDMSDEDYKEIMQLLEDK